MADDTSRKPNQNSFSPNVDLFSRLQSDKTGFQKIANLLQELVGIHLPMNEKNLSLMASRLAKLMSVQGLSSYADYLSFLDRGDEGAISEFISQMTTNTTQFFREEAHIQLFQKILPALASGKKEVHIWCAACSTGQEPYTLAMAASEALGPIGSSVKILATDIDQEVLSYAYRGVYSTGETESLPAAYKKKYFSSTKVAPSLGEAATGYQIDSRIRKTIDFAEFNLSAPEFPFKEQFDFVFCRNVLIYFDRPTTATVVENLSKAVKKGGYLFLGHSESGVVRGKDMSSVATSAYKKESR